MIIHKLKIKNKNVTIENIEDLHYNNMVYRLKIAITDYFSIGHCIIKDYKTLSGIFNYIRKNLYVRN